MTVSSELLHILKEQGIQCYVSFPDKWLGPLLQALDDDAAIVHIPATIEREALGIAVGAQLAGMRSALVMQNSGIGNLLNDWASLAYNYGIPIPWIVSDRGSTGEQVMTQTIWHGRLCAILDAAQIPARTFVSAAELPAVTSLIQHGYATHQCVAALFPYDFWRDDLTTCPVETNATLPPHRTRQPVYVGGVPAYPRSTWRRFEALAGLMGALHDEFLFVTLGDPCKEVYRLQDRAETFYMLGSMGLVLPLGLGFARAYAALGGRRKTVVVDGDGSQLMQLGSLGTFAREQPDLALIVMDNASYGSTGNQPTLTRTHVALEGVARAFGLTNTATVGTPQALESRLHGVLTEPGPSLTVVSVSPGAPVTPLLPLSPTAIAQRFVQVALQPAGMAVA
jgi:sulfopyruvate decarboxylase alpha subunit